MLFNAKMKSGHLRISVSSVGKINCKKTSRLSVFARNKKIKSHGRRRLLTKILRENSRLFVVFYFSARRNRPSLSARSGVRPSASLKKRSRVPQALFISSKAASKN